MEKFSASSGFTLIELLVVFAIIGVLSSLGVAAYSSYNGPQSVQSAAEDFSTLLNNAKSRSISQVIPSSCGAGTISGYEVDVTPGGQEYTLYAVCDTKIMISDAQLPYQVTFASSSAPSVFFNISSGTVLKPVTVTINGFGKTRTVDVTGTGSIQLH